MSTGNLAKWQILLSEFDIIYVTQKAVKRQALADHLVENSVGGECEPLTKYFPDEEVSFVGEDITEAYDGWRIFFDGAANFKGVGIGAVLVSETGQHYNVSTKLMFPCTNIMAEYEACIMGLYLAIDMNIQELLELMKIFTKIEFKHLARIQNEFVDALATLSSMIQHPDKNFIDPIMVRIHNQPDYCNHAEEETGEKPWLHDIKEYLAMEEYSEQENHTQKRTLQRHKFILVAIDYFTKWVKAASYEALTKKVVTDFVKDCIICRFGVPESIITDNAANINSDQIIGVVETANKNIKKTLRKMVENHK
ncbi:uncharacterized protein [Nicotiana sylvestris]|uniref:uncharacterized protein n=1 Tax=Nicotiana sylvestris TaxID=4096 RepID=UPI00388C6369